VIDTIGLSAKNSYIDSFRTPHTEKLHVVERFTLSADRKSLTAIYRPGPGETRFTVTLRAFSNAVDATTGQNFQIARAYDFFTGVQSSKKDKVTNIRGGSIEMEAAGDEEEDSQVVFSTGTFLEGDDLLPRPTTQIEVGIRKGKTKEGASAQALRRLGFVPEGLNILDNPNSLPREMVRAMDAYRTKAVEAMAAGRATSLNPLSAFYDIFLPLGVRTQLKSPAQITLQYDVAATSGTVDPNALNVWYYNPAENAFLLENTGKEVDLLNHTVSVSVNHLSVFVLSNNAPQVSKATSAFDGGDIEVFNFPNPFNLQTKTVDASQGGGFGTAAFKATIRGTMIRAGVPAGLKGFVKMDIFSVTGERVRTINYGDFQNDVVAGRGNYLFFDWDGRNDRGKDCGSGVYIGMLNVAGRKAFVKMALVK